MLEDLDSMAGSGAPDGGTKATFKGDPLDATFFTIRSLHEETPATKINCFAVTKTIEGCIAEPQNITRNHTTKEIIVELKPAIPSKRQEQVKLLLGLKKILDYNIEVTAHPTLNSCRGVIFDSEDLMGDLPEEDILNGLKDQNVTAVRRIKRKQDGELVNTRALIITFSVAKRPQHLKVMWQRLSVKPYYPNPLRCYKCQRYGPHSSKYKASTHCGNCSSTEHSGENCKEAPHCANCDGDHPANSRSCPRWDLEKKAMKIKVDEDLSFREARKRVEPPKQPTYAAVTSASNNKTIQQQLSDLSASEKRKIVEQLLKELHQEKNDDKKQSENKETPESTPSSLPRRPSEPARPEPPKAIPGRSRSSEKDRDGKPDPKRSRIDRTPKGGNKPGTETDRSRSPLEKHGSST